MGRSDSGVHFRADATAVHRRSRGYGPDDGPARTPRHTRAHICGEAVGSSPAHGTTVLRDTHHNMVAEQSSDSTATTPIAQKHTSTRDMFSFVIPADKRERVLLVKTSTDLMTVPALGQPGDLRLDHDHRGKDGSTKVSTVGLPT